MYRCIHSNVLLPMIEAMEASLASAWSTLAAVSFAEMERAAFGG